LNTSSSAEVTVVPRGTLTGEAVQEQAAKTGIDVAILPDDAWT
jgi:hypothetical protein